MTSQGDNANEVTRKMVLLPMPLFQGNQIMTLEPPQPSTEIMLAVQDGISKRFVILYRPTAGNSLHLYDHELSPILDETKLYNADYVVLTNHKRRPGEALEGVLLFDHPVLLYGLISDFTRVTLEQKPGSLHSFVDEFSFLSWDRKIEDLSSVRVHID